MRSNKALRVWLPLRDVGPGIGSMRVYEGSHANGVIDHDAGDAASPTVPEEKLSSYNIVEAEISAGTGILFDMMLVHESTPNTSNRIKFILTFTIQDLLDIADPDDPADHVGNYYMLHRARTEARSKRST